MSLDHALTVLDVAKPFAKLIPVVGEPLEGVVELLTIGCKAAQVRHYSSYGLHGLLRSKKGRADQQGGLESPF
jgi:hypothetical protein